MGGSEGDHDGVERGAKAGNDVRMLCSCFIYRSNEDEAATNSECVSNERGFCEGF